MGARHGGVVWICRARKFRAFASALRFRAFAPKLRKFRAFAHPGRAARRRARERVKLREVGEHDGRQRYAIASRCPGVGGERLRTTGSRGEVEAPTPLTTSPEGRAALLAYVLTKKGKSAAKYVPADWS